MKIVKLYDVGDTVVVEPYSIFSNPTPVGWNTKPNGYGIKYDEGYSFIFQKSLVLYAQYTHVQVSYHIISAFNDGSYMQYDPSYVIKYGSHVQVADFGIQNFKTWLDENGNQLSIGQYMLLTSNVNLYMSADCTYELCYDANGGEGEMQPSFSTEHLYFSNGQPVIAQANVMLPECLYRKKDYVCEQWKVYGNEYTIGKTISLSSNATAYAQWGRKAQHRLEFSVLEVRHQLKYRYMMLKILATFNNTKKRIALANFSFIDSYGNIFQMPENATAKGIDIAPSSQYNGFMPMFNGVAYANINKFPCFIVVDMKSQCFDAARYTSWTMSTSSQGSINAFPNAFQLYFSNDGENWFFADECNYVKKPSSNNQVIANGLLVVSQQSIVMDESGGLNG